ncbi:MAG: transcription antitermination factor NusB [Rhodothermales bacterium]|nr:transcription antitermination factor NusB [Rhodothermales bacterium]
MSTRRESREKVLQALYAFEQAGGSADHIMATLLKAPLSGDPQSIRFAEKLFLRTLELAEKADGIIGQHTQNWELSRIALIDRLILRMGICEMMTFADIPPKVSINEAIEVAKKFSTARSGQFVNGILDASLVDLKGQGLLKKSGRGLVGMTLDQEESGA